MSGYNYGIMEVEAGPDDANATPKSQVASMIAAAIPEPAYGGVVAPSGSNSVALNQGDWTVLPGTFVVLPSQNITGGTNGNLTFNGTSRDMIFTFSTVLAQDQASNDIYISLFRNGEAYNYETVDFLTSQTTTANVRVQLFLSAIIPAEDVLPGDIFAPRMTTIGANATVTRYQTQFYMQTAN